MEGEIGQEERDEIINGAFEELTQDNLRSFSLVTMRDSGIIVHTHLNAVGGGEDEGQVSDAQAMLAYEIASWSEKIGVDPTDLAVAAVSVMTGTEVHPVAPDDVEQPVPSLAEQIANLVGDTDA